MGFWKIQGFGECLQETGQKAKRVVNQAKRNFGIKHSYQIHPGFDLAQCLFACQPDQPNLSQNNRCYGFFFFRRRRFGFFNKMTLFEQQNKKNKKTNFVSNKN